MKRILYIAFALLPISGFTQVDKQVEVTKEYTPTVEQREKITLMPEMSVDGSITPDIDYSITPRSIETSYDVDSFAPVEIKFWEYQPDAPLYIKLGGGAPATVVGDLYYTHMFDKSYFTTYANYDGIYGRLRGLDAIKRDAREQHSTIGSRYVQQGAKRNLNTDISYNIDQWSRYASDNIVDDRPLYQSLMFNGGWGDSFTNFDSLNIGFNAGIEYHWSRSDCRTEIFTLGGDLGHKTKKGVMLYNLGCNYVIGEEGYENLTIGGGANYSYSRELTSIRLGASLYYDHLCNDSDLRVLPTMNFNLKLKERKAILFVDLDSELTYNNYATLSKENPYIAPALYGCENSVDYRLSGGVKGAICGGKFGYSGYASYRLCLDNISWALVVDSDSGEFLIDNSNLNELGFNLDLSYDPHSNISFRSDLLWRAIVETPEHSWESGLANFEYEFGATYNIKRFRVDCHAEILGERKTTLYYWGIDNVGVTPTTVDLGVNLDYRLKRGLNIFCDLSNLLNEKLYPWYGYSGYGIGAVVGVQLQF